jgi:hypothetical protein
MIEGKYAALPGFTASYSVHAKLEGSTSLGLNRTIDSEPTVIPQIIDPVEGAYCKSYRPETCNWQHRYWVGKDFCSETGYAYRCSDLSGKACWWCQSYIN